MGELNFCTVADILHLVTSQFIADVTTDTGFPFWLIRLLHNKFFYGIFFSSRCYFLYFDLNQLTTWIPILFIAFIALALFAPLWRKRIILIQLLMPVVFILNPLHINLAGRIDAFTLYYNCLATIGLVKLILLMRKRKKTHHQKS